MLRPTSYNVVAPWNMWNADDADFARRVLQARGIGPDSPGYKDMLIDEMDNHLRHRNKLEYGDERGPKS